MTKQRRLALVAEAQTIVNRVEQEGRQLSSAERGKVENLILEANVAKLSESMSSPVGGGRAFDGLYGALMADDFDRKAKPFANVPIGAMAATFDGDLEDMMRVDRPAVPLGADRRYLWPELPLTPEEATTTSVASFRQKSRQLPTLTEVIRDIGAITAKPEVDTVAELVTEAMHQIAVVETEVPNVIIENPAFRGWINTDLSLTWNSAIDLHVLTQILATSPATADGGANFLESAANAAEAVVAAGYSPNILAASPEDLLALRLLRQPGTDDYVAGAMDFILAGLRRVAVVGLDAPMVLDSNSAGRMHLSPGRLQAFEENNGTTNSSTVRLEANGVFIVQRVPAIALLEVAS
jgi:hypothetical protein